MDDAFTAITAFNLIAAKFENEQGKDADAK